MKQTVLEVIHTSGAPAEMAYAMLKMLHRPEVVNHGASLQDADGNPSDTAVLIEADDGSNGSRDYSIRLAGPLDALSSAVAGDTV